MKETVEVYEQGTGKLIDTYEQEVPDPVPSQEDRIAALEEEVLKLKKAR